MHDFAGSEVLLNAGATALTAAIMQRRPAAVQLLLQRGADPERANVYGATPLTVAQVYLRCYTHQHLCVMALLVCHLITNTMHTMQNSLHLSLVEQLV